MAMLASSSPVAGLFTRPVYSVIRNSPFKYSGKVFIPDALFFPRTGLHHLTKLRWNVQYIRLLRALERNPSVTAEGTRSRKRTPPRDRFTVRSPPTSSEYWELSANPKVEAVPPLRALAGPRSCRCCRLDPDSRLNHPAPAELYAAGPAHFVRTRTM